MYQAYYWGQVASISVVGSIKRFESSVRGATTWPKYAGYMTQRRNAQTFIRGSCDELTAITSLAIFSSDWSNTAIVPSTTSATFPAEITSVTLLN